MPNTFTGFDSDKPYWFSQIAAMQLREATPDATIQSLRGSLIYIGLKDLGFVPHTEEN